VTTVGIVDTVLHFYLDIAGVSNAFIDVIDLVTKAPIN
jgi:hypothetical protein